MFSGLTRFRPMGCAPITIAGGGTPSEPFPAFAFDPATAENLLLTSFLSPRYGGAGLTLRLLWRSTATTGSCVWRARLRRINTGAASLLGAHDYWAAAQTVTTATAGTASHPVLSTVAFTNGAQMESLAAGEAFALMIGRNAASGSDTLAVDADLIGVDLRET